MRTSIYTSDEMLSIKHKRKQRVDHHLFVLRELICMTVNDNENQNLFNKKHVISILNWIFIIIFIRMKYGSE